MQKAERDALARKRILSVLQRHGVANSRTLEQKISDAGPTNQRINPHILTPMRRTLQTEGLVNAQTVADNTWYSLGNTPAKIFKPRLDEQVAAFKAFTKREVSLRVGQALEIATYRALLATDFEFFGRYTDLDDHDDGQLYSKEEPQQHIGKHALDGKQRLDFIARHPATGYLGIECKNIREWLYPNRDEIRETLRKCLALNCVPVIIARRIPFVTFKLMQTCGVIVHQTYNQLMAEADSAIAAQVKHKDNLGYHDIRLGNQPDKRLQKFIGTNMMAVVEDARAKFDKYSDLLTEFSHGEIDYKVFAAKVRRRSRGQKNEDNDWDETEDGPSSGEYDFDPEYEA